MMVNMEMRNPKHEMLNNIKTQNHNEKNEGLEFRAFEFWICLVFRD